MFISVGVVSISMRTGERETDSGNTRVAQHDIAAERKKKKKTGNEGFFIIFFFYNAVAGAKM